MATLPTQDRATACAELQRDARWVEIMRALLVSAPSTVTATKPELRALIDALDQYFSDNATALNSAIPANIRNKFSMPEKALAAAFVLTQRASKGA